MHGEPIKGENMQHDQEKEDILALLGALTVSILQTEAKNDAVAVPAPSAVADVESSAWFYADRRGYCNGFANTEARRKVYVPAFIAALSERRTCGACARIGTNDTRTRAHAPGCPAKRSA